MGRKELEDQIFADFEPLVRDAGAELLDVEILTEYGRTILRAYIYRPDGVTLDDCVAVQDVLSLRLDETDPIPGSYCLEVSSPGLERVLRREKEFAIFAGRECQVNLYSPYKGKRVYVGKLAGLIKDPVDGTRESVVLETDKGIETFDRRNVSKVQLRYVPREDVDSLDDIEP